MAVTVTVEVPPLHSIGVAMAETTGALAAVTVAETCDEQPLASVTVKLYVPGVRLNTPVP